MPSWWKSLGISWKRAERQSEAVNLKHDQVADLLLNKGIYPAFHMNKRYWISVALDDAFIRWRSAGIGWKKVELNHLKMKHFNIFQRLSISKIFSYWRNFQKILIFLDKYFFAYAKILNKISNEGESQTWKQLSLINSLCCWGYSG